MSQWIGCPKASATKRTKAKAGIKFTRLESRMVIGKISLGKYTFLMREELLDNALVPALTALLKKVQGMSPERMNRG